MARATINLKSGSIATVEGDADEVARIVALLGGAEGRRSPAEARNAAHDRQRSGPSAMVDRLRDEGFFDRPKSLADIGRALEERGFLFPVTTLSGVVLGLLKKGRLHRKKIDGRWVYGR